MALDIYVGSMTRYLAGHWETVARKAAREAGHAYEEVLPGSEEGDQVLTDPEEIRPLAARSDLWGVLLLLHCWGIVAAALASRVQLGVR